MKFIDITGNSYGGWEVLSRDNTSMSKQIKWVCRCTCGIVKSLHGSTLKNGKSTSCGSCGTRKSDITYESPDGFTDIPYADNRYSIDEYGNVFNKTTGTAMKPSFNDKGYPQIVMVDNNRNRITRKVHRLVAEVFIPNVDSKPTVNHIDGVKTNNHISNLEWSTYSENQQHAYDTGLCPKNKSKLGEEYV